MSSEPRAPMNPEEFREWGKRMVDFAADYWAGLRERKPLPDVKPGYIWDVVPAEAPKEPESWEDIFADLERTVVGPNTHWHHPHFFAYYPTANSYPAIMADILSASLGCIGFSWNSSPSCTELEMAVMDWLAKAIGLPTKFLNSDPGTGAGMIQCTASDSTLVAILAARSRICKQLKEKENSTGPENAYFPRLVAYCSDQAHSSVERAALLAAVTMKGLPTTKEDDWALRGETLAKAMAEDRAAGLVPFFVCGTVGATTCCAVDRIPELGKVCSASALWLHVDAAYAGSAAICPELRGVIDGVELADSFNFNAHKWLCVNFDCSAMWFAHSAEVGAAFHVDPLYLKHAHQGLVPDYRHWQVPLGRRFRSIKLWMVFRAMGISGLQAHVRTMVELAKDFAQIIEADQRFELFMPPTLGLVCFRLKAGNEASEALLEAINKDRRIHLVPSRVNDVYFLRLAVCSSLTTNEDIVFAADVVKDLASAL